MKKICRVIIFVLLVFSVLQLALEDHVANGRDEIKTNGPVGGPGGRYFRDRIPEHSRVSEIIIRVNSLVSDDSVDPCLIDNDGNDALTLATQLLSPVAPGYEEIVNLINNAKKTYNCASFPGEK